MKEEGIRKTFISVDWDPNLKRAERLVKMRIFSGKSQGINSFIEERQRAEGRRQKGFVPSRIARTICKDRREQGFKTPTKLEIWWLLFRRGLNPLLKRTFCPQHKCLLPSSTQRCFNTILDNSIN